MHNDRQVVRREVPEHAAIGRGARRIGPLGCDAHDLAQVAAGHQLGEPPHDRVIDVHVPDHQRLTACRRKDREVLGRRQARRQRLFDQDVLAREQGPAGELEVSGRRRGHDDDLDVGSVEHAIQGGRRLDAGTGGGHGCRPRLRADAHGTQRRTIDGVERTREIRTPMSVPDQGNSQLCHELLLERRRSGRLGARATVRPS
jgi:hypothetical protein